MNFVPILYMVGLFYFFASLFASRLIGARKLCDSRTWIDAIWKANHAVVGGGIAMILYSQMG